MKTVKDIYESVLIEQYKLQAPSLKLYEFNYFLNKAVQLVVNKKYNLYDMNQQITDDLKGLKVNQDLSGANSLYELPPNYFHILNCICLFNNGECGDLVIPATKITSDSLGSILTNYYNKPSIYKPYFEIINGNSLKIYSGGILPTKVTVEYLKTPTTYTLTKELLQNDGLNITEFPDYMIQEIINELVYLALERASDPRLPNNALITLTIANPTQLRLS